MTKQVGTTEDVLRAFLAGQDMRTTKAQVPGGARVTSEVFEGGITKLYSYRTVVAVNMGDNKVAVTTHKYSVTTSKLVNALKRSLQPSVIGTTPFDTAVPGRWGGFGPAWHPTGVEVVHFDIFEAKW